MSAKRNRTAYFKRYNAARRAKRKRDDQANSATINAAVRRRRLENLEYFRDRDRKYYARTYIKKPKRSAEEKKESRRRVIIKFAASHPGYHREQCRAWRAKNQDRERLRAIQYRLNNPVKAREITKRYDHDHPDKARLRGQKRRAMLNGAAIDLKGIASWEKTWRVKKIVKCFWCLKRFAPVSCHADHITPLCKGGMHALLNLCISCALCNSKKYSKSLSEWNNEIQQPVLAL